MPEAAGRLAGLLGDRRAAGRDLLPVRDRDVAELFFGFVALREVPLLARIIGVPDADFAAVERRADVLDRRADVVRDRVVVRRAGVARAEVARAEVAVAIGFADDMVLAAVISALAAVVIALVAVFIDCMADDIVLADAVALVAAAVILVAADVTLVAADETPLAAVAGVAELRLAVVRRVVLRVVLRLAVLRLPGRLVLGRRAVVERDAVPREAVDRDAVLRVDRDVELRVDARLAVLRDGVAAVLRLPDGMLADFLELDVVLDRLAVPRDALRVTGLLRAELAELRRLPARVVDLTGTDSPPVLINYEECYSTHGEYLHTRGHDRPEQ